MRNYEEVIGKNELYIWVRSDGIPNIPGMPRGPVKTLYEFLPKEARDIKESYWDYILAEESSYMVVMYKGDYGILFQWDFSSEYTSQFSISNEKAERYLYVTAIDMENGLLSGGEVFIELSGVDEETGRLYLFVPESRLPIKNIEYPLPRRCFENVAFMGDELDVEWIIAEYETKTGFHLTK